MFRIFFLFVMVFSFVNAVEMGKSGGGCTLTQKGEFKVGYNNITLDKTEYIGIAQSGKNFRSIFVGSKVVILNKKFKDKIEAEIIDYKPNKRIKGKPKTGIFIVKIGMGSRLKMINMNYIFDSGVMYASAVLDKDILRNNNSSKKITIWFKTDVEYSLRYVKK